MLGWRNGSRAGLCAIVPTMPVPFKTKYTRELLAPLVGKSVSVAEVMRRIGMKKWTGGSHNLIQDRIRHYGLDTSHFTGSAWNHKQVPGSPRKLIWREVLVLNRVGRKEHRFRLERAMLESGISHVCAICSMKPVWKRKPLVFAIDHINGDHLDNRPHNVRFLCPNCHSQTPTYGSHNASRSDGGTSVDAHG